MLWLALPVAQAAQPPRTSLLVGDSLGMVVLGYESTVSVTMDEMIHHTKAVSRGAHHALVIGDMPFMSYSVSPEDTMRNAARFLREAGAQAVKLEGAAANQMIRLLEAIEDHDDVQNVYSNFDVDQKQLEEVAG